MEQEMAQKYKEGDTCKLNIMIFPFPISRTKTEISFFSSRISGREGKSKFFPPKFRDGKSVLEVLVSIFSENWKR